jgi:hypothetical protein
MAQSAYGIDRSKLESGFNNGVARAKANGLPEKDITKDRDVLLDKIQEIMEKISAEEQKQGKAKYKWSQRGAEHAAEDITIFEIAWRQERTASPLAMTDEEIESYLRAFRRYGNCWSHD